MCAERDHSILPQIAQNFGWIKLIDGAQLALTAPEPAESLIPELGTPGRKAARRKNVRRLARALAGQHTRTTASTPRAA